MELAGGAGKSLAIDNGDKDLDLMESVHGHSAVRGRFVRRDVHPALR
jgi:hypothetical protein